MTGEASSVNICSTGLVIMTLLVCQSVLAGEPPVIPFGEKVTGSTDIAEAWHTQPTERYPHAVLGDDIEAGAVLVKTRAGEILTAELDVAVFEDTTPWLADIDAATKFVRPTSYPVSKPCCTRPSVADSRNSGLRHDHRPATCRNVPPSPGP